MCGTAFYKIVWDCGSGCSGGEGAVCEGDVSVAAIPPFEVYPDSLSAESMEEVTSLIHARAMPVKEILERYGVELAGRTVERFASPSSGESGQMEDAEIVIERYTRPDRAHPLGRLEIAAGGVLPL